MAITGLVNFVTDSLVMYFDAANNRSYVGSGNTWTDLTYNSTANVSLLTLAGSGGINMGTYAYWKGMFSSFITYNRSLTSTEVKQTYYAFKGRFGL